MKPPPPPSPLYFTASAMMMGTAASTPKPAMFRRRSKISDNSERKNRVEGLRDLTGVMPATSAADPAALPRQRHEHVRQIDRCRTEGTQRHVFGDQRLDNAAEFAVADIGRYLFRG